jgi:hypothetical protein
MHHTHTRSAALGVLAALGAASPAHAQEAMYTAAATMPGPGNAIVRVQPHVFRYGSDPNDGSRNTTVYSVLNTIHLGLVRDLSLAIDAPVEVENTTRADGDHEVDTKIPDVDFTFKYRFYRSDPGGIDTVRAALLGGVKLDTDNEFNADPHLGVVITQVSGRHGWNAELHYTLTTGGTEDRLENLGGDGTADAFMYNLAYVYRIDPPAYTSESIGAWYVTGEVNGMYETNGDHEIHFSPGLMYEGRRFGFEVMAKLPLFSDVDNRPELDWALGFGFRWLF